MDVLGELFIFAYLTFSIMKAETYTNQRMRTCLWIVNTLERHKALTLQEINELWRRDDSISDGHAMDRRTFYNYVNAISSLLKIVIECDRRDRFRYKITGRFDDDKTSKWLISSFATSEAIASSADIRERVLLEDIPSGYVHLNPIMEAMRTGRKITFEYQRFCEGASHMVREAEPYCVKLYQQRWYVLVKELRTLLVSHERIEEMHVYSLDRIQSLEVTNVGFEIDPLFDAKEFFRYAFGTRVERGNPPCTVRLKVAAQQVPYLRTLPLHHSQHEVETADEYSIFELNVALTVELYLQILHYGSLVEVPEPEDLRDVILAEVHKMAEMYGIIEPPSAEELEAMMKAMEQEDLDFFNKKFPKAVYGGLR